MTDSSDHIPAVKLSNDDVWRAVLPRLEELVSSGRFILGPEVYEFERAAAQHFGTNWCVGTSSGTSALVLALKASDLPKGARVAVPANTFFATFEAVIVAGFRPVLIDHDADHLIDLEALETAEIEGIIPVHLYGLPVDMERLMQLAATKSWWVLEDCAQAHGATIGDRSVGSFGHAGAFSAYPTKNLGAWGDAGFIVGREEDFERRIRALRHHGQIESNLHHFIGGTHRLDNLQALVLTEKLTRLSHEVAARREVATFYRDALAQLPLHIPSDRGNRHHAYHQFVVRTAGRDRVRASLEQAGIATGIHYPHPLQRQRAAEGLYDTHGPLERSESWSTEILSLPIYPGLSRRNIDRVAAALIDAISG